jgi:biotin transport system substrate-specific component
MSNLTLAIGRPTLVDRFFARSLATDVVLVAAGAALTAIAAQLVIPLWPVPITGQTFAVLLVGAALGATRGALSLALYLVLGVAGLPVFAAGGHGSLFGSTSGGFVVGFVFAAALTGWLAQRKWDHKVVGTFVAFAAGTLVMYAFGLPWLYTVLGTFPAATMNAYFGTTDVLKATVQGGILPFLLGDLLKALIAAAVLPLSWHLISRAEAGENQH